MQSPLPKPLSRQLGQPNLYIPYLSPTYVATYLPTYLRLRFYLRTYVPTYAPTYLPAYLPYLRTYLSIYLLPSYRNPNNYNSNNNDKDPLSHPSISDISHMKNASL